MWEWFESSYKERSIWCIKDTTLEEKMVINWFEDLPGDLYTPNIDWSDYVETCIDEYWEKIYDIGWDIWKVKESQILCFFTSIDNWEPISISELTHALKYNKNAKIQWGLLIEKFENFLENEWCTLS